jgi:hypothetical protein
MTIQTASGGRWAGGEFRVGRILDRTISTYKRHFLPFSSVTLTASAIPVLLSAANWSSIPVQARGMIVFLVTAVVAIVLALFGQTVIVHGAFQALRNRRVNLLESAMAGLRRFVPIVVLIIFVILAFFVFLVGVSLIIALAASGVSRYPNLPIFASPLTISILGVLALIVAGLMLAARWFIVIPICLVERLGPWRSLTRSAGLTQGHRWKIVGIILLAIVPMMIIDGVVGDTVTAVGGRMAQLVVSLAWYSIFSAFFAIMVAVTYYELRQAKDGADIEQIASVFD